MTPDPTPSLGEAVRRLLKAGAPVVPRSGLGDYECWYCAKPANDHASDCEWAALAATAAPPAPESIEGGV